MKNFYKVVFENYSNEQNKKLYYISTSVSALIYWLGYNGADLGAIVEIKRISRLPKGTETIKAI